MNRKYSQTKSVFHYININKINVSMLLVNISNKSICSPEVSTGLFLLCFYLLHSSGFVFFLYG